MSEEIVRILTVQTGNSTQTINNLKQAIKSLRQELSKAQVGSKQYNDTLRELTQVQRQYSLINKDISERSKAQEVNLQTMAQLGQNLAKTYSSINAVIGLLGDNNEDLNKSMLKVQRTIQLIQGLSGIGGLIKQIPQLLNGFKSWLSSFDPLERKVANIAKGINAIDGKKLNQIAGLQGGSIKIGDVSAKATAGGLQGGTIPVTPDQVQEVNRQIIPLNEEWSKWNKKLIESQNIVKGYRPELSKLFDYLEEYNKQAANSFIYDKKYYKPVNLTELSSAIDHLMKNGDLSKVHSFFQNLDLDGKVLERTAKSFGLTTEQLTGGLKNLEASINDDTAAMDDLQAKVEATGKAEEVTAKTTNTLGTSLKQLGKTVGWTLAVTLAISAIMSLISWLGKAISKWRDSAKEVREFNKAIREGTAQGSAKAIVILKELSIAYQKVGDSAKAKEQFLVDYNDKIKETGIAVNDVNTADDVFIKNTAKYVKALEIRARAQATENYAIKKYEEYLIERDKLLEKRATAPTSNNPNPVGGGSFSPYNTNTILVQTVDDIDKAIKKLDTGTDSWMEDLFTKIANLKASIAGIFDTGSGSGSGSGGGSDTKENPFDIEAAILKTYLEDVERYQDSLKSAKDKEIEETEAFYDRLIVNAAKFGNDYEQYVRAREAAVAEIEKKYADEELENQKKQAEDRLSELDAEINRIRSRYDTSNIQKVREQTFQTNYRQPVTTTALGLGPSWLNTYQSGQNVKDEYNAQVTYNNKILELTRLRIEQENALLNQQLEVEGITADRRMEIERTLAENKIALSDAVLDNEEANLQAYKKMQESRQQALNATLSVASNVMGGMASLMKAESENTKKSDKQRANSFKAYKAFSIAQAITDTYKAANESYSAMASIPYVGPALGAAAAIAAVIAGIANVRRIQNEEISTSSSSSSVAVTAPAMQTNPIEYQRQLLGDQELDELNKPMKCYVLESEITSTQNKVKVSESNSSF